jgi:hypothetical protein
MADEKTADKLMKSAEKSLQPSVMNMRLKPDWDEAFPLFEKAAVMYRVRSLLPSREGPMCMKMARVPMMRCSLQGTLTSAPLVNAQLQSAMPHTHHP